MSSSLTCRRRGSWRISAQRHVLLIVCLGLIVIGALPVAVSALWPDELQSAQKRDPRYVSQSGSLAGTRRQAIANANDEAVEHAVETCAAAGLPRLASRYGVAPDVALVAARYARDFEASAQDARRAGCVTGLREGG